MLRSHGGYIIGNKHEAVAEWCLHGLAEMFDEKLPQCHIFQP